MSLIALIRHLYRRHHILCLHRRELRFLKVDGAVVAVLLKKGIPMSAQLLVISLSGVLMITLVNRFGVDTTAAFGAALQIWNYIQMPAFAVGMAVSAMTAQNVGAGKWHRVTRYRSRTGVLYSMLLTGSVVLVIEALNTRVFGLFLPAGSAALDDCQPHEPHRHAVVHFLWHFTHAVRRGARHRCGHRATDHSHDLAVGGAFPVRRGASFPAIRWMRSGGASRVSSALSAALAVLYYRYGDWRHAHMAVPARS